jgi:hypothetical protein
LNDPRHLAPISTFRVRIEHADVADLAPSDPALTAYDEQSPGDRQNFSRR